MWKIYSSVFLIILVLGGFYFLYNENQKLQEQSVEYRNAAEVNEDALDTVLEDIENITAERERFFENNESSREVKNDLLEILRTHDMGNLAEEKPNLIENRVNDATKDINRCMEIISGDPLTMEEIDADKPSEINNYCSDIANPNFND